MTKLSSLLIGLTMLVALTACSYIQWWGYPVDGYSGGSLGSTTYFYPGGHYTIYGPGHNVGAP